MDIVQYPNGRVVLDTIQTDSTVIRMDTLKFSIMLAKRITDAIESSEMSKQQVSNISGIPWATLCRRLEHPERSFLTIPETISICDVLGLDFVSFLSDVETEVKSSPVRG